MKSLNHHILIIFYLIFIFNEFIYSSSLYVNAHSENIQETLHVQSSPSINRSISMHSSDIYSSSPACSATCPVDYVYVSSSSTCHKCAAGTQCPCEGTKCVSCPGGKFNTAGSGLGCQNCPLGQYTASPNSGSCNYCPAGTYSLSGKLYCTNCPLGQYQVSMGQSSCVRCPSGTTTSTTRSTTLAACISFPTILPTSQITTTTPPAPANTFPPNDVRITASPSTISPVRRISAHPLYIISTNNAHDE